MAIVGKGAKSIKKKDLSNQKSIGIAFKKLRFWHKAIAGESGINLLALNFPTELVNRSNPSKFELSDAKVKFFRDNLTIRSSLRGVLMDDLAYDVPNNLRINWKGFATAEGEIFEITMDENAKTGPNVVDGRQIICSGVLPAGETDINIGTPIEINVNPTANIGSMTLHIDRGLQLRNSNNSASVKDKDYHEVDPGGGFGTILRVNTPDISNDREYVVMSLGVVAEKPNQSQLAELEKVQGQIDAMVPTLAVLAGVGESNFQSSGPNNIDLKAFGSQVTTNKNTLEAILDMEVPIMTDWVNFPSTDAGVLITGTTSDPSYGTVVTNIARWRRVGSNMEIEWNYRQTGAGSAGSGIYLLNLPPGYNIDLAQVPANTGETVGVAYKDSTVGQFSSANLDGNVAVYSETQLKADVGVLVGSSSGINVWGSASGQDFNVAAMSFGIKASVPIDAWEATQTIREALGL